MKDDSTKFLIIGLILGMLLGYAAGYHIGTKPNPDNDLLRIKIGGSK